MKREKKKIFQKAERTVSTDTTSAIAPKTLAEKLGISAEVLLGEPKITVTGDYLVEIVNHKGIISFSQEQIEVNTRKYVYKIIGKSLVITALTDEEISIFGNVAVIEKL